MGNCQGERSVLDSKQQMSVHGAEGGENVFMEITNAKLLYCTLCGLTWKPLNWSDDSVQESKLPTSLTSSLLIKHKSSN